MTEDPSGSESDDEPADGNEDSEPSPSSRDAADADRDPFEETFIVKETEELDSQAETTDESSIVGNSWLDESGIDESEAEESGFDEADRTEPDPTDERALDRTEERSLDRTNGPPLDRTDERPDDDWGRIPIDLASGNDEPAEPADDARSADEDDPYQPEPSSTPVVPGDPSLEGAVFVVLGAIAMILVMFRLASVMIV